MPLTSVCFTPCGGDKSMQTTPQTTKEEQHLPTSVFISVACGWMVMSLLHTAKYVVVNAANPMHSWGCSDCAEATPNTGPHIMFGPI